MQNRHVILLWLLFHPARHYSLRTGGWRFGGGGGGLFNRKKLLRVKKVFFVDRPLSIKNINS